MSHLLQSLIRNERGATAVEYGLMLAMMVLAMMAALNGVATETITMWDTVADKTAAATGN